MICDYVLFCNGREENMRKLVCDRCGKEIDESFGNKYDITPSSMIRIYGSKLRGTGGLIESMDDLEYELCQNCTNQLVTFLKG